MKWTYYEDTDWWILWRGHLESRVWSEVDGTWFFKCWWHGLERELGERSTSTSARLAAEEYLLSYKPQRKSRTIKQDKMETEKKYDFSVDVDDTMRGGLSMWELLVEKA
jgi:hypothetical protein